MVQVHDFVEQNAKFEQPAVKVETTIYGRRWLGYSRSGENLYPIVLQPTPFCPLPRQQLSEALSLWQEVLPQILGPHARFLGDPVRSMNDQGVTEAELVNALASRLAEGACRKSHQLAREQRKKDAQRLYTARTKLLSHLLAQHSGVFGIGVELMYREDCAETIRVTTPCPSPEAQLLFLSKLQRVFAEGDFTAGPGKVRLKPGIGYCLRRFYPLVQQLARSHWIGHIKGNRRNVRILGEADDLEEFLFASSRQSLETMSLGLRKLDGARCFYCGHSLTTADVDHYIPFSQYPRDLAHNFVLAHPACNRSKSDTLAALHHLERWLERLQRHSDALAEIGADSGFVIDVQTTQRVGSWAYANAVASGAQAWIAANTYCAIDHQYTECFA